MNAPASSPVPKPKRRLWRILRRVVMALVIVAIVVVFGVFPYLIATLVTNGRTRPADRALTETPETYGVAYRNVSFQTADGVTLRGWLLPSRQKKTTIIYSHGLFRSRRELLERAVDMFRRGYGGLLYDSRNHGESGPAKVTLGYNERLDAEAAVNYLREAEKSNDKLVLFGISMGAGAALLAAAETPEVSAVVSDSSFLSFSDTTNHHVKLLLHLPAFPFAYEMRFFIEGRGDFDGSKLNALDAVKSMGERPILFIAGARDPRMPPTIAQSLHQASGSAKSELYIADGPESVVHGHAYQAGPQAYIERIDRFLTSALNLAASEVAQQTTGVAYEERKRPRR